MGEHRTVKACDVDKMKSEGRKRGGNVTFNPRKKRERGHYLPGRGKKRGEKEKRGKKRGVTTSPHRRGGGGVENPSHKRERGKEGIRSGGATSEGGGSHSPL